MTLNQRTLRTESSIGDSTLTAYWNPCESRSPEMVAFAQLLQSPLTDSNRRPPSLPCAPIGNWSQPVATGLANLSRSSGIPMCHQLPLAPPALLHKRSIAGCLAWLRAERSDSTLMRLSVRGHCILRAPPGRLVTRSPRRSLSHPAEPRTLSPRLSPNSRRNRVIRQPDDLGGADAALCRWRGFSSGSACVPSVDTAFDGRQTPSLRSMTIREEI